MNAAREEHFFGKVTQKALIIRGDSVLITRDSRDVVWELPGGRLNNHEDPEAGLKRELREELGVEVLILHPFFIQQFEHKRDGGNTLLIAYAACLVNEEATFAVDPVEVAELVWVDKSNWMRYELFPEYRDALAAYFASL